MESYPTKQDYALSRDPEFFLFLLKSAFLIYKYNILSFKTKQRQRKTTFRHKGSSRNLNRFTER